jgi:uncharacterized membrane protein YgcG
MSMKSRPSRAAGVALLLAFLAFWAVAGGRPGPTRAASTGPLAGPPFPAPVTGQRVYDTAGIFSGPTLASAAATIATIEQQTGAQVVVYTQVKPGATESSVKDDAAALGNEWKVGRAGFDDGLVLFFDMDATRRHGKVAFVGGSGFRATYLDDTATQRILDDTMLPLLVDGQFDAGLLAGLASVQDGTTPAAADRLQFARTANAVVGLVVAPLLLILLAGFAFLRWYQVGRDPVYLDSPSIYLPAPPDGLTAATGALLFDGRSSRRALTTALLDLASRDEIAFFRKDRPLAPDTLGVEIRVPAEGDPRIALNRRSPLGPAETSALKALTRDAVHEGGGPRVVEGANLLKFGESVAAFEKKLEQGAVEHGWFAARPAAVTARWLGFGLGELLLGVAAFIAGLVLPASGLAMLGGGLVLAGVATAIIARAMPARTRAGAVTRAMLAAYRRTLAATLASARSMDAVAAEPTMAWLGTPDRAVVWAAALGLTDDVQRVFDRTTEDVTAGRIGPATFYQPAWYSIHGRGGDAGGWHGVAPGLASASPMPDLGGMFAALSSVGNTPSSSGSGGGMGGGGGFSGGSSGSF